MHKHITRFHLVQAVLFALLFTGCAMSPQGRILLARNCEPDALTEISNQILSDAARFKKRTYAMNSMDVRLDALRQYSEELRPRLTDSFGTLLSDYVAMKLAAFKTAGPASRFDTAQDDPILQRGWEPDVELLSREGAEEMDKDIVVVNELLLDGKIHTGYQGETKMIFRRVGGSWLLDDVVVRRRYSYDDSRWEKPKSTRSNLRSDTKTYAKDLNINNFYHDKSKIESIATGYIP